MKRLEPVVTGLDFPECPRWHEGALWWSDMQGRRIHRWTAGGGATVITELDDPPGGLGWSPDGALLAVAMFAKALLAIRTDGTTVRYADLAPHTPGFANDMVVAPSGTAYVGTMDALGGAPEPTPILAVAPDGSVAVAAADLRRPNGCVVAPDGRLVVAESAGERLTAFRIGDDGTLHDASVWAALPGARPDGIGVDGAGAVWVADLAAHAVVCVAEGGAVSERIAVGDRHAVACVVGGADGRTLFVCTSGHLAPFAGGPAGTGRIEAVAV